MTGKPAGLHREEPLAQKLIIIMVNTDPRNGEELGAPFFQATVAAAMDYDVDVICTATCPSAHYYDYSPREIVQLLWTENLEGVYDAMQEKIWSCAQCYTCAARCPFENSPGGLVMIMREVAIKHKMESVKNVLRPFSRVLLKVISTGNQLAPNMITREAFPDWGPNVSKVDAPLAILRKAIPVPTLHTLDTAWVVNLKTSVELYSIWEATGVLDQLESVDENLFDVVTDVMDEKREEYQDWLDEQEDADDE